MAYIKVIFDWWLNNREFWNEWMEMSYSIQQDLGGDLLDKCQDFPNINLLRFIFLIDI